MDIKTALTGPLKRLDAPRPPAQDVAAAPEAAPVSAGAGDTTAFSQGAMAVDGLAELPPPPWEIAAQPVPPGEAEKPALGNPGTAEDGALNVWPASVGEAGHVEGKGHAAETKGESITDAPPPSPGPTVGDKVAANCLSPVGTEQMLPHMCVGAMAADALMKSNPTKYKELVKALVNGEPYEFNGKVLSVPPDIVEALGAFQRNGATDVVSDAEWAGLLVQTALMRSGDPNFDPRAEKSNLDVKETQAIMKLVAPHLLCLGDPRDVPGIDRDLADDVLNNQSSDYNKLNENLRACEKDLPDTGYVVTIRDGEAHLVKFNRIPDASDSRESFKFTDQAGNSQDNNIAYALTSTVFYSTGNVGTENIGNVAWKEPKAKRGGP